MGFRAFRAARTPRISTFLYMHGPSLSGYWYPARRGQRRRTPQIVGREAWGVERGAWGREDTARQSVKPKEGV